MKIHWKTVMFVAVIGMLLGLTISVWGIGQNNIQAAWIGLITIGAVCVSWWFWVMFVIRTMIDCTDKTNQGLGEIKQGIHELRGLVRKLDFNNLR